MAVLVLSPKPSRIRRRDITLSAHTHTHTTAIIFRLRPIFAAGAPCRRVGLIRCCLRGSLSVSPSLARTDLALGSQLGRCLVYCAPPVLSFPRAVLQPTSDTLRSTQRRALPPTTSHDQLRTSPSTRLQTLLLCSSLHRLHTHSSPTRTHCPPRRTHSWRRYSSRILSCAPLPRSRRLQAPRTRPRPLLRQLLHLCRSQHPPTRPGLLCWPLHWPPLRAQPLMPPPSWPPCRPQPTTSSAFTCNNCNTPLSPLPCDSCTVPPPRRCPCSRA
jgi:hypothetical protein